MWGYSSEQIVIGAIIISAVLVTAILITGFIFGIQKRMRIKMVKKHSILYKHMADLNARVTFNDFTTEYTFGRNFATKRDFQRTDPRDILIETVGANFNNVGILIECIEQNIKINKTYTEAYNDLWRHLGATDTINLRLKFGRRRFIRIEKRLYHKLRLRPKVDVKVTIIRRCYDRTSNTSYEYKTIYDYEGLKDCFLMAGGRINTEQPRQWQSQSHTQSEHFQSNRSSGTSGAHYRNSNEPPPAKKVHTELYRTLEVPNTATLDEIKTAYRKMAKLYHPDRNPASAEKFKTISSAYEILSDETKRAIYDRDGTT
jgi:DNA segregation ATPase FtsK/SpoIIIE-like protein